MQRAKIGVIICMSLLSFTLGCGLKRGTSPGSTQTEQVARELTPEMIAEYALIHQMSDLKIAEFYLTNPDYAERHPYQPTEDDLAFYESKFLGRMYPGFNKLAEKAGLKTARRTYLGAWGSSSFAAKYKITEARKKTELIENAMIDANNLYDDDRLDDAIKHMKIVVETVPDSPKFLYNLGVMYMKKGNYREATECFQDSLKIIRSTGYTNLNQIIYSKVYMGDCINLGLIFINLEMYDEAVKILKEAIQFMPDDLDANWNLGVAYWHMGDMEQIAAQMRRYINLDPKSDEAHNTIGLIYYRKKLYNAALDEFRIAAKLYPNQKQYKYNVGLTLARLGRHDEASAVFQRVVGLEEGEELRRIFIEEHEANKVRELYNDGCAAMESRSLTSAIELFKAALELETDMADAHVNLGVCYRMRGDKRNQIHHFEEAVRLRPDLPNIRYNLGIAYSDSGIYRRAIGEFRQAVELSPHLRDARFSLGTALCRTGNYSDAAAEFEKCLELSPDWFEAHLNLGTCYLKTGGVDGAIDKFREAVRLRPDSAEAHYNLGAANMNAEKLDEASAHFREALDINPGHKLARIMLQELEE